MITPIRGRKLTFKSTITSNKRNMFTDDNPDKGTETVYGAEMPPIPICLQIITLIRGRKLIVGVMVSSVLAYTFTDDTPDKGTI